MAGRPNAVFRSPLSQTAWLSRSRRLADSNCCFDSLPFAQPCGSCTELGFRLASLADGEGCFTIARQRKSTGRIIYQPQFRVKMRADDTDFLRRWQLLTGLGRIYEHRAYTTATRRNCPSTSWAIGKQDETLRLVAIFELFPLWSKKARDFEVWSEAVRYHSQPELIPREGRGNPFLIEQAPLADCHARLRALRSYAA